MRRKILGMQQVKTLQAPYPQINQLEDELINCFLKRTLGLQRWLAKLCFAM